MFLKVQKISPDAKLPVRAHATDAGLDIFALEETVIAPNKWQLVRTGIKIALPEATVGLIWDKSGLAAKGLTLLAGVIDEGYRGEILINVLNLNTEDYKVEAGQKIAQLLVQPITYPEIIEAEIDEFTERGEQGHGSTGLL